MSDLVLGRSEQLQALMRDAAEKLTDRLRKQRSHGHDLELGDIAAMAQARAILQTVAIFIADEASAAPLVAAADGGKTESGRSLVAPAPAPVSPPAQER